MYRTTRPKSFIPLQWHVSHMETETTSADPAVISCCFRDQTRGLRPAKLHVSHIIFICLHPRWEGQREKHGRVNGRWDVIKMHTVATYNLTFKHMIDWFLSFPHQRPTALMVCSWISSQFTSLILCFSLPLAPPALIHKVECLESTPTILDMPSQACYAISSLYFSFTDPTCRPQLLLCIQCGLEASFGRLPWHRVGKQHWNMQKCETVMQKCNVDVSSWTTTVS